MAPDESDTTQTDAKPFMLRRGTLIIDGWAGRIAAVVAIIGETPKRYRIQAIERTQLAGYRRFIDPGEMALVPKSAITRIVEVQP